MATTDDYKKIMLDLRAGKFKPVYVLHGEESFFIDRIAEEIEHLALQEHERDFNQSILYARDVDADTVKDTCLRFPMMAERQLVIVRELNTWRIDQVEKLEPYLAKPTPSTILVLCYKHKKIDGRKSILKTAQKGGAVVFTSDKVREDKLPETLMGFAKHFKRKLGAPEAQLLANHLGSDLAKTVKEVEKLCLVTEEGGAITADVIQKFVGISKEYNVFELQNAIGTRNAAKAQRIAQLLRQRPQGQSARAHHRRAEHLLQQVGHGACPAQPQPTSPGRRAEGEPLLREGLRGPCPQLSAGQTGRDPEAPARMRPAQQGLGRRWQRPRRTPARAARQGDELIAFGSGSSPPFDKR